MLKATVRLTGRADPELVDRLYHLVEAAVARGYSPWDSGNWLDLALKDYPAVRRIRARVEFTEVADSAA